jgi:peptidyl-prolyl cis-trans isomerase SurA
MENSKKILIVLVIILIVGSAGWFLYSSPPESTQNSKEMTEKNQNMNTEDNSNVVARVNDEPITSEEFTDFKKALEQRGAQVSEKDVIDELINQKLLLQEAKNEGYSLTEEQAESALKAQLKAQDKSLNEYKQELNSEEVSYNYRLSIVKNNLIIRKYLNNELEGKISEVTDEEARDFYDKRRAQSSDEEFPPYEKVESQMKNAVKQQKKQEARISLAEELREDANIEYVKEF